MADITLACPQCSRTLTVSEFAERTALRCPGCGASLSAESAASTDPSAAPARAGLRLKPREPSPEESAPPVADVSQELIRKRMLEGHAAQAWRDFLPLAYWLIGISLLLLSSLLLRSRVPSLARWALGAR